MTIYEKLAQIQQELVVPKSRNNKFGGFMYRSAEDIMNAVKPLARKYKALIWITDEPVLIGSFNYVQSTVHFADLEAKDFQEIKVSSQAREEAVKKGMDASQVTGSATSYARKYALGALLMIDDEKDADSNEYQRQTRQQQPARQARTATRRTAKQPVHAAKSKLTTQQVDNATKFMTDYQGKKVLASSIYKSALKGDKAAIEFIKNTKDDAFAKVVVVLTEMYKEAKAR